MLEGRKIIVGVTGSIAAYKAAFLTRELLRCGASVRVAMTESATRFISPLTFSSLTKHAVALNMYPDPEQTTGGSWHIDWGLWADAMIVAPASAATIAKLGNGISDNALTVIATALRGQLFVAPAMDVDMYRYPALRRNLASLRSFGVRIIPPGTGELASGLTGEGRLAEPEDILETMRSFFSRRLSMRGMRVVITAGPTHEPIDPVRYISNHSSGKMGYALAEEAAERGADVTLISGPVALDVPAGVNVVSVRTAEEMASATEAYREEANVIIGAAAVADFTPVNSAAQKMKRRQMADEDMVVALRPTQDILKHTGQHKKSGQVLVGFALETENLLESARAKLAEKNCDLIVANPALEEGAGFGEDTNRITLVGPDAEHSLPQMSKRECASEIFDAIERIIDRKGEKAGLENGRDSIEPE